jgi:Antitoxin Xre/MbcA/ParS C-terminal toxin-binding domain
VTWQESDEDVKRSVRGVIMNKPTLEKNNPLIYKVKQNVLLLRHLLRKLGGTNITLGKCYNLYANFKGYTDWHVMSAVLKKINLDVLRATDLAQIAMWAFDNDKDEAFKWLNAHNIGLNGKKPVEIWGNVDGAQEVYKLLLELKWEFRSPHLSSAVNHIAGGNRSRIGDDIEMKPKNQAENDDSVHRQSG